MPSTRSKKNSGNPIVIAGAGMTGLMCALRLRQIYPDRRLIILDKSVKVGGMYGSFTYPEGLTFDYGMHVIYESCNSKVDDLYREIMPENEWHVYKDNEKDIAGLFFKGRLQTNSHYVDLRSVNQDTRKSLVGSLLTNLEARQIEAPLTALDFLRNQFGSEVVQSIHDPILRMMYGTDPDELDVFAAKVSALERVILFDSATMLDLMKSSKLRARLAFPDQLDLPALRENNQKALYPKKFGMTHFIDKLRYLLESRGVEILTEVDISEIGQLNGRIENVVLRHHDRSLRSIEVDKVLWTAGWPSLAKQIGIDISDLKFQKGPEMIFVNLILSHAPTMDRLYYFYCYDEGFASFRVTNYSNYCPAAGGGGRFPVCVELWPSKIGLKKSDLEEDEWVNLVMDELRRFGVIGADHDLLFAKVENNVGDFPMPTTGNTNALNVIRARVRERQIDNLEVAGVMAKEGLFFIPDILNDAFEKLNDF